MASGIAMVILHPIEGHHFNAMWTTIKRYEAGVDYYPEVCELLSTQIMGPERECIKIQSSPLR